MYKLRLQVFNKRNARVGSPVKGRKIGIVCVRNRQYMLAGPSLHGVARGSRFVAGCDEPKKRDLPASSSGGSSRSSRRRLSRNVAWEFSGIVDSDVGMTVDEWKDHQRSNCEDGGEDSDTLGDMSKEGFD